MFFLHRKITIGLFERERMNKHIDDIVTVLSKLSRTYRNEAVSFRQTRNLPLAELEKNQLRLFRGILRYCDEHIPFYREALHRVGKRPEDFVTLETLQWLPIIDKKIVRDNFDMFIPAKLPLLRRGTETSGTTGFPSFFYRDLKSVLHEQAALDRYREDLLVDIKRTAVFRGGFPFRDGQDESTFWKIYPFSHECVFQSSKLGRHTIGEYDRMLRTYRPDAIYAYPSVAYQMARLYREVGMDAYHPKIILTSSEMLKPVHRELIESVFQCQIRDWYGQAERVVAIGQCKAGTYHIIEDYSLVELLKTEAGVELVGSGLKNQIMPLLRYRTNDEVLLSAESCSCGSPFRVIKSIMGRQMMFVVTPEGEKVPLFPISDTIDVKDHIHEVQFVHKNPGVLTLNIIPDTKYGMEDEEAIIRKIKRHTSERMVVNIIKVDSIPKGPNGKMVDFITNID